MDATRVRYVIVCFFLLFGLVLFSEGNRKIVRDVLGNEVPWNSPQMDQDMAEHLWIYCREEIDDSVASVRDSDFYLLHSATVSYNKINNNAALLTKIKLQKTITNLPPQLKQTLLDCLRGKFCSFRTSGNVAESRACFNNCLGLIFGWSNAPRRYLVGELHQHMSGSPAPAPAPEATFPAYAPAPAISPSPMPQNPPTTLEPTPPPKVKHPPPRAHFDPHPAPHNKSGSQLHIIIALGATSVALLLLVAVLCVCCLKGRRNKVGPRDGQRDDKPLLNLCLSDMSGSSQNSHGVGHSSNKNFGTLLFVNKLSTDGHGSSAQLSEAPGGASGTANALLPLPPGRKATSSDPPPPPPPGPPPPPPKPPAPSPPPPPKVVRPHAKPSPLGTHNRGHSSSGGGDDAESDSQKAKLKPFFWDKVLASPEQEMVWHELKAGSFQVNEEMMESLFGYTPAEKKSNERRKDASPFEFPPQYIQIIDGKKSQNLAILLKALNVTTEEVCDALQEGNELPPELVQTLLKMAPTTEEELKLRLFNGDLSQLGPAERFLKVMVDIPFAFKRLESLLFMSSFQEELSSIKESFQTLEVACMELKKSRLFLKLLEAVLKTGNRMNDGTFRGGAQAFKLDTLLKLSDVKGMDGKTTLLHFVVQEIIRSEGIRAARVARQSQSQSICSMNIEDLAEDSVHESPEYYCGLGLEVVSRLSNDLVNVRKAALIDGDSLSETVYKLDRSLSKSKEFLNAELKDLGEESEFQETLASFLQHAEGEISWLQEEEKRIMALVKSTADYFHGHAGKDEGLRLFVIVRDFFIILDKVCAEVGKSAAMPTRIHTRETPLRTHSTESRQSNLSDVQQRLFPAVRDRRVEDSSSDDESLSP